MTTRRAQQPRREPADVFALKFRAAAIQFSADFLKTDGFRHALTKGEEREAPVQRFLRENLPSGFGIERGEAVDPLGAHSPQLDAMLFDRLRNIPVHAGGSTLLPAEALLASVEVKTELTKSELVSSFRAASKLRSLRPFKRPLIGTDRGAESKGDSCRYFHVVFAYKTDLVQSSWLEREHARVVEAAADVGCSTEAIDRVYVAERGLIHPGSNRGIDETGRPGLGLMNLYMHLLNFVLRENRNRNPAPYEQYSGRMTDGWKAIRPKDQQPDDLTAQTPAAKS